MVWGGALLDWLSRPGPSAAGSVWADALEGLEGNGPLPWWAAGLYQAEPRRQLLRLRDQPNPALLEPWLAALLPRLEQATASFTQAGLLVPVPSWKRRANPLPSLLARGLAARLGWHLQPQILRRSRPVLGQHHLGRQLRLANQEGAFLASPPSWWQRSPRPPVLLVDDILTTGATAGAASLSLQQAGWRLIGLACLARTPSGRQRRGRDLQLRRRVGDRPG